MPYYNFQAIFMIMVMHASNSIKSLVII